MVRFDFFCTIRSILLLSVSSLDKCVVCVAINFNTIKKIRVDKCKIQCFQQFVVDFGTHFIKDTGKFNKVFVDKRYVLLPR